MSYLVKRNCVVLIKIFKDKTYSIIGVFKNKKYADKYLGWLEPKNKESYQIIPTSRYVYTEPYEPICEAK